MGESCLLSREEEMGEQIALPSRRGQRGVIDTEDTLLKIKSVPSSGAVDRRGWEIGDINGRHMCPRRG